MNATPAHPASAFEPQAIAPAHEAITRPFYWSIRRELWENRSVYLAPLIVAAVVLFASMFNLFGLPRRIDALSSQPAKQRAAITRPFAMAPAPIMLASFLVGLFYSLDALYGDRRDRSILFWKSLPVSDRTVVLSKATIPIVALPLIALALSVSTFTIMLFGGSAVLVANGMSPGALWREVPFVQLPLTMLYGLTIHALWFAPIYCWLLLVSAWARRTPLLWVVLPPFAVIIAERIVFGSTHFASLLRYRVVGAMREAFEVQAGRAGTIERIWQLEPIRFLSAPGLWLGLIFAAVCIAAAVRLRRKREPL
ncbi:MAG TPA: ABC transporter permease [Thermoanaerobaculia bacterium]|nr:ABC transporter permease [Thermoanaerobaculia bacterium]